VVSAAHATPVGYQKTYLPDATAYAMILARPQLATSLAVMLAQAGKTTIHGSLM